eukprot:CAMPEP_0184530214 /NCGR_PEP_ID=MMETSP0198_2-20121128/12824_1 /TAXON_ID=1112570 /ORGANISM="Thraustochytrium sp., Strain LLF1b" /LENGTH=503 /DNA_ID=CAMNT_0026922349 /DNA_START=582 /DNA_END=2093 /DNA_ORIENTATION=+
MCEEELSRLCSAPSVRKDLVPQQFISTSGRGPHVPILKHVKPLVPLEKTRHSNTPHKLRFVPKATGGLRPVMNCRQTNFRLVYPLQVLKAAFRDPSRQAGRRPQIMGLAEFFPVYKRFVQQCRSVDASQRPKRFTMLAIDIERCYDNINQKVVLDVVEKLAKFAGSSTVTGHHALFVNRSCQRVRAVNKRVVEAQQHTKSLGSFERSDAEGDRSNVFDLARASKRRCIFVDRAERGHVSCQETIRKVRTSVSNNYCSFGSRLYKQLRGIPQGLTLSPLLCTAYFEHFERSHVDPLLDAGADGDLTFCTRMLDDYLVISSDPERIKRFAARMEAGFIQFGIKVKKAKNQISTEERSYVNWCGYRFNAETLSVTFDPVSLYPHLTPRVQGSSAHQLRQAMQTISLRCDPLLFDREINSAKVALRNMRDVLRLALAHVDRSSHHLVCGKLARFAHSVIASRCQGNIELTLPKILAFVRRFVLQSSKTLSSRASPQGDTTERNNAEN